MKATIFLLIAAVVVGAIAVFVLLGADSVNDQESTQSSELADISGHFENVEPKTFFGEGSLFEVQRLGVNVECRISYDDPELLEPVIGMYFVSGDRVRGDFEMNVPELGGQTVSSIIVNDNMFYSWSNINGELYGVKFENSSMIDVDTSVVKEPVPSDAWVSYDCKEWKEVDNSIFEPPSSVLFQDMSELINSGMEYGIIYENGEF